MRLFDQMSTFFLFAEADIPVVGNVFSFVFTKYPPDWRWQFLKVSKW